MLRYFYAWTPLVIVATVVFLALPWLGLIALMVASLAALAVLAFAVVVVPLALIRAAGRLWQAAAAHQPAPTPILAPAPRRSAPAQATVLLAHSVSQRRHVS